MIAKASVAALALACTLAGPAFAAPPTAAPNMAGGHVAPGAGRTQAVTERANQIRANKVFGLSLREPGGKTAAVITDLIVEARQGAVAFAVLKPSGADAYKGGRVTVPWSRLKFQPTPTPRFVTALSPQALSSAPSFKAFEQKAGGNAGYYEVKKDLLGQKAVGPHGQPLGQIRNLVFDLGSGRLVALVIGTGGALSVGEKDHAVAWGKARPSGRNPVHLALSKNEVDAAPVTTSMTPLPQPQHSRTAVPAVIRRSETGNLSGTSIPGPATSR